MALVGRIARAHGLRGQVILNPETDFPEERFQPGAELFIERKGRVEPLTISSVRFHRERPIVGLGGVGTVDDAEALAGHELRGPVERLAAGILGRAIERGTLEVRVRDLRDFTTDRHRVVDDVPYGGGPGMVLKPEPIFRALDAIEAERGAPLTVVMTSPQGRRFTQAEAQRLCGVEHIVLLCGRYEGFDDRVRERVTDELSIGDYVLTGGELPALVILDAVARFVPGVVGDEQSVAEDSFSRGLLDFPQFTRPAT